MSHAPKSPARARDAARPAYFQAESAEWRDFIRAWNIRVQ
jgi:hypothetical protein